MFERFTTPARRAVETAETRAREATAGEIRPEHLLAAVLSEEDSVAVRVLADAGAPKGGVLTELTRLRVRYVDGLDEEDAEALLAIGIDLDEVVRRLDRNLGGSVPARGRLRFSRESKKVLQLALREAVALRHGYIGTEHLLLGLLRSEDRLVCEALAAFDVDADRLRAAVADAGRRAG